MILYLDCSSGISGDMLVGALLSLAGAREADPGPLDDVLRPALAAAGIDPRLVRIEDVRRGGMAALAFRVADEPGFATFDELIMSLYASDLEQPVADAVAAIAERMAAAEAEVHGRDEEHLHELSDVDTAVDLICAVTLLEKLAPERIVASPPALGDGEIETAHGGSACRRRPCSPCSPACRRPAARRPCRPARRRRRRSGELTTPTGAALVAHFAGSFGGVPAGRVERIGYGAGRREVPGRPNVLRAVLVDPAAAPSEAETGGPEAETATLAAAAGGHGGGDHVVLEANIDDMTPELLAHAADCLREAGALDVWMSQALMKKGRPGVVLHVLAAAADRRAPHRDGLRRDHDVRSARRRLRPRVRRGTPRERQDRQARGRRPARLRRRQAGHGLARVRGRAPRRGGGGTARTGRLRGRPVGRPHPLQRLLTGRRAPDPARSGRARGRLVRGVFPAARFPMFEIDRFCGALVESITRRRTSPPVTVRPSPSRRAG